MNEETTYTRIKAKCKECGLHFVVCTWYPDRHTAEKIYCPECGQQGNYIIWHEKVKEMIYNEVPGDAEIIGIYGE